MIETISSNKTQWQLKLVLTEKVSTVFPIISAGPQINVSL